jgi:hypothetical protein
MDDACLTGGMRVGIGGHLHRMSVIWRSPKIPVAVQAVHVAGKKSRFGDANPVKMKRLLAKFGAKTYGRRGHLQNNLGSADSDFGSHARHSRRTAARTA